MIQLQLPDDKKIWKHRRWSKEDMYPTTYARFMYMVAIRKIKAGEELAANYNLYTYPKTGVGLQMQMI